VLDLIDVGMRSDLQQTSLYDSPPTAKRCREDGSRAAAPGHRRINGILQGEWLLSG
jgi:hypothetical protein